MTAVQLHVCEADALLERLKAESRRVAMAIFSPPYALKAGRYGATAAGVYPNDPPEWARATKDLIVKATRICDGVVLCVTDSPLDKNGVYQPANEMLTMQLHATPWVKLLRPIVWSKNGPPGSTYWPSHGYEQVIACCHWEIKRPHYSWEGNAQPSKYDSGPGRQRNADGSRRAPAKKGMKKGRLARPSDVIRITVGGGHQGLVGPEGKIDKEDDRLACSGEAPFPVRLADWFVRACSNPGDTVLDFCCGTGTVAVSAALLDRAFVGCDVRESQISIAVRRLGRIGVTPEVHDGSGTEPARDAG